MKLRDILRQFHLTLALILVPSVALSTEIQTYQCLLGAFRSVIGENSPKLREIPLAEVSKYLPDDLRARDASLGVRLYREVRARGLKALNERTRRGIRSGVEVSERNFAHQLEPGKRYTLVITDDHMLWAPKYDGAFSQYFSKHLFVAGGKEGVRFAGEIWTDANGVLHLDNDSGTFATDPALLPGAQHVLQDNLPGAEIEVQARSTPAPGVTLRDAIARGFAPQTAEARRLMEDPAIAPLLDTLKLEKLQVASHYDVYLAKNADGEAVAIYKSEDPSNSYRRFLLSWDPLHFKSVIEKNGYSKRNEFNYILGKKLGFEVVTPTLRAARSDGQTGSLQKFLTGYRAGNEADPTWVSRVSREQAQQLYLIDTLLGRGDGHPGNWMVNSHGDLKMIDTDRILYRTRKFRWQNTTSIEDVFPQAKGQLVSANRAKFLNLTPKEFNQLLDEYGFPADAKKYALDRLEGMQSEIKENKPIEQIVHDFSLLHASQSTEGDLVVLGKNAAQELAKFPREEETKLVVPSKQVFARMKELRGQVISLRGPDGETLQYRVRRKALLHEEDVYYDTPDYDLNRRGGVLRDRKYYLDAGLRVLFKSRFEAKSGAGTEKPEAFSRENAKGEGLPRTQLRRQRAVRERLSGKSWDPAVAFARQYARSNEPLLPSLSAHEDRDYLAVYPMEGSARTRFRPCFYISLDEVSYVDLRHGRTAPYYEAEVEIADPASRAKLSGQLQDLKDTLKSRYDLASSERSKYASGLDLTVPEERKPKKVLILWASIGGGHLSSGSAIAARLKAADPEVQVEFKDICDFLPKAGKLGKSGYLFTVKHFPAVWDLAYRKLNTRGLKADSLSDLKDPYNNQKLAEYLKKADPDVIISTYDGGALSIGNLREAGMISQGTRTIWYNSNYPVGYMPRISQRLHQTFVSHSALEDAWVDSGVDKGAVQTSGPAILQDYYAPLNRKTFLKAHGLDPSQKTILLSGGGEGILDYNRIIESLQGSIHEPVQICAVTGKNDHAYHSLEKLRSKLEPNIHLVLLRKLKPHELSEWVRASDLYIVKAGANSPAEAFVANKAVIVRDIMRGHETQNANFYGKQNLALVNRDPTTIGEQALRIFHDPALRKTMSTAQAKFRENIDLDRITRYALAPLRR